MKRQEIEKGYQRRGLATEYVNDPPGKVYKEHKHNKTYLFTLSGSVTITIDGSNVHELTTGQEFIVKTEQLHSAVVGSNGWEYVAAFDPIEEEKYKHVIHE